MKILFITSTRIGDAVLSTGVLRHIENEYPEAKVTVACGPLVTSFFEGVPFVERVIALKKEKRNGHWVKLWKAIVGTKWDMVVDLRNSAVSRLIFAKKRFIFGGHISKEQHKVEQIAEVLNVSPAPAPKLWFTESQMTHAKGLIADNVGALVGVGPTANWIGKTWPIERFIDVTQWLISNEGPMNGATVAVFGAPGEEEDAYRLYEALPEAQRLDLIAKGSPGEAAACLSLCDFYLGNDSGLMHCAAAAGVKTVGLFGASYPHIYSPWGDHTMYVRTPETFDELTAFEGYDAKTLGHSLMKSLSVESVRQGIKEILGKSR